MSTSGGGSKDSGGSSSSDREYTKSKTTAGTGRAKDLSEAVTASLSPTGGEATVSKGATEVAASSPYSGSNRSLSPTVGGGGGDQVGTTVVQKPPENPNTEGPEGTSVTPTPRSDFSVVLAGQTGTKPSRSPSRSNNFVSLVGGAGGLGRRTAQAKRTLIGGA